ncbi:MAG: methyltransferase domain-containing protein [Ruminococcaceae bacterium]|nr:methyltransferase domain-containing protein [Oscillospiraceae bacterium]
MPKPEQLGPYTLEQPEGVFPLGGDTLALGAFATVRAHWQVCDLGTGSGALLLLLAGREPTLSLTGIELNPAAARAAQTNLTANKLNGQVLCCDLRSAPLPAGQFDLAISNPPYFSVGSGKSGGSTRCEEMCTLDELCAAAARLVKNGGRFALCHRPERLTDVLCTLREHGLEPKRLKLLSHSPSHTPFTVLIESVRQGKPGLDLLPTEYMTDF